MSDKPTKTKLNKKDSQLLIRISTVEREQFSQLCEKLDTTAAREIRLFIREFINKHKFQQKLPGLVDRGVPRGRMAVEDDASTPSMARC